MSIEAMKQALEALEVCEQSDYGRNWVWPDTAHPTAMTNVREAITALRQAIAEAEKTVPSDYQNSHQQEPVAFGMEGKNGVILDVICPEEHARLEGSYTIPLYTHPPKRESEDLNAAKAEIIQAERERLAMLCERLPFGNTAHSFAAWIRNGGQA